MQRRPLEMSHVSILHDDIIQTSLIIVILKSTCLESQYQTGVKKNGRWWVVVVVVRDQLFIRLSFQLEMAIG
jgi:hypothetical protein